MTLEERYVKAADLRFENQKEHIIQETEIEIGNLAENSNARGILSSSSFYSGLLDIFNKRLKEILIFRGEQDFQALITSKSSLEDRDLAWLKERQRGAFMDFMKVFIIPKAEHYKSIAHFSYDPEEKCASALTTSIRDIEAKYYSHGQVLPDHPITSQIELNDYSFIQSKEIQEIVKRDIHEINIAIQKGSSKTTIILAGSIGEALLLDALRPNEADAKNIKNTKKSLEEWDLFELIDVALKLNVINADVDQFSHALRNYRNLIHPGKELRDKYSITSEVAAIGVQVIKLIIRSLNVVKV